MTGNTALATWTMQPARLTDGEINAELRDPAIGAERRAALRAEMNERRVIRAAMGQEARQAAAKARARAAALLGTGGQR